MRRETPIAVLYERAQLCPYALSRRLAVSEPTARQTVRGNPSPAATCEADAGAQGGGEGVGVGVRAAPGWSIAPFRHT